jgi:tRNA G18 (ribose-2'-O)-methylase SpoU
MCPLNSTVSKVSSGAMEIAKVYSVKDVIFLN